MTLLIDLVTDASMTSEDDWSNLISDQSEADISGTRWGKVSHSANTGTVEADRNVGGDRGRHGALNTIWTRRMTPPLPTRWASYTRHGQFWRAASTAAPSQAKRTAPAVQWAGWIWGLPSTASPMPPSQAATGTMSAALQAIPAVSCATVFPRARSPATSIWRH